MDEGGLRRDVLLVEDDEDLRTAVADVLRDQGCRVYLASDGEQALAILRGIVPDLIVTDLMMPRMNGWDLCAAIRENPKLSPTPVAVLSAFVDIQPITGVRMIRKPLDVHALVSLLDAVVAPAATSGGDVLESGEEKRELRDGAVSQHRRVAPSGEGTDDDGHGTRRGA